MYSKYPCVRNQSSYHVSHSDYVSGNLELKRIIRMSKDTECAMEEQIVKTDALFSESLVCKWFYVLVSYKKRVRKKIQIQTL